MSPARMRFRGIATIGAKLLGVDSLEISHGWSNKVRVEGVPAGRLVGV